MLCRKRIQRGVEYLYDLSLDIKDMLCGEIDDLEDLAVVSNKLKEIESRTVYMCFSADMLHSGHIAIIKKHNAWVN